MIERYSDHAANERTFLAWVRTAIAIMAFGFLVQKFDLFLRIASASLTAQSLPQRGHIVGDVAGLVLIVLGGAMMVLPRFGSARPRSISTPSRCGSDRGRDWILFSRRCFSCWGQSCLFTCPIR